MARPRSVTRGNRRYAPAVRAVISLALLAAAVACTSAVAAVGIQPQPVKACGSIAVLGKRVTVDIAEGVFPLACSAARAVMGKYLAMRLRFTHPGHVGSVFYRKLKFDCYTSRLDGVGWDFHCMHDTGVTSKPFVTKYVDVGGGRR
jgi:hypothetical protein